MKFGIYPDYGFVRAFLTPVELGFHFLSLQREAQTTARQEFDAPSRQGKHLLPEKGPRFGMVTKATYWAAQFSLAADAGDVASGSAFDAVIKTHGTQEAQRFFETTARADYGGSGKPTRFQQLAARSATSKSAGGSVPVRGDISSIQARSVPASGLSLEEAAKRSWIPGGDPGLAALAAQRPVKSSQGGHASLQLHGSATGVVKSVGARAGCATAAWQAPARKTLITGSQEQRSLVRGRRVFADE